MNEQHQQGDIFFQYLDELPDNVKVRDGEKRLILAEGETTGHFHRITSENLDNIEVLEDYRGQTYLNLKDDCTVVHEEHLPLILKAGLIQFGNINEYDYSKEETVRNLD